MWATQVPWTQNFKAKYPSYLLIYHKIITGIALCRSTQLVLRKKKKLFFGYLDFIKLRFVFSCFLLFFFFLIWKFKLKIHILFHIWKTHVCVDYNTSLVWHVFQRSKIRCRQRGANARPHAPQASVPSTELFTSNDDIIN